MMNENEEVAQAQVDIWKYVFGFTDMAVVRCAIELGIPDILENQVRPMTLSELSSAVGCSPSTLYRIMRFLVHRRIFDEKPILSNKGYVQTPLSSLLTKNGDKVSMSDYVLLLSTPLMLAPWLGLSKRVLTDSRSHTFLDVNGKDIWSYSGENSDLNKLFNNSMAGHARLAIPTIIDRCPDLFHGLESIVDVGGGNGTALRLLVKNCTWIRGINFDLPHVVASAEKCDGVVHIAGDMFESIPKADAVFIMWVLHDWGDEECIKILKNCKLAINRKKEQKQDYKGAGKVIIVDSIIKEDEEDRKESDNNLEFARLMMDIGMMAETEKGKERTMKEWEYVLKQAGFSHHTVEHIQLIQSVIVAYR